MPASHFIFRRIVLILGLAPVLVGAVTIAGWEFDSYAMKRIIDSPIPVNPLTSVLFMLLGLSILCPALARAAALLIGVAALIKCCDMFLGTDFHIDMVLYASELPFEPAFPNRMAPTTTLCFLCMALALGLESRLWRTLFLLLVTAIALYTIAAYVVSDGSFRLIPFFTPMALITAITFFVSACGVWIRKN